MTTLEIQKQNIDSKIKSDASASRVQINKSASGTKREPKTFTVESKPTASMKKDTSTRQAQVVEVWRSQQLASVARQEKAAHADVNRQYTEAKNAPVEYDTTGLTEAEIKILNEYGVDEINRRRQLENDIQYASAVKSSEDEMKKDYVKVAGNQWISKDSYSALSKSDKELVNKVGRAQFNNILESRNNLEKTRYAQEIENIETSYGMTDYQRKTFEALPTVEAKNNYLNMLSGMNQTLAVSQFGLNIVKAAKEASQATEEVQTEQVYSIETDKGTVQMPAAEWDRKDDYDKLTVVLGRAPTLAEYKSYKGVGPTNYGGGVIGTIANIFGGIGHNIRAGLEPIWHNPSIEAEETVIGEYANRTWPNDNSFMGKVDTTLGVIGESLGFGAVFRPTSPTISISDITPAEWKETAISAVALTLPLGLKVASAGVSAANKALINTPGLGIIRQPLVTFSRVAPSLVESGGLKVALQSPVKFVWGNGLVRAGLPKLVSSTAVEAGNAAATLSKITSTISKVDITSPRFLKLQSALDQAKYTSATADFRFLNSLGSLRTTTRQLKLLESRTGYKNIGTSLKEVASAKKSVEGAWADLRIHPSGSSQYIQSLGRLSKAQTKLQNATTRLDMVLQPRTKLDYGTYDVRGYKMNWESGGRISTLPKTPTQQIMDSYKPMSKAELERLDVIRKQTTASYYEKTGIRPLTYNQLTLDDLLSGGPQTALGELPQTAMSRVAVADPLALPQLGPEILGTQQGFTLGLVPIIGKTEGALSRFASPSLISDISLAGGRPLLSGLLLGNQSRNVTDTSLETVAIPKTGLGSIPEIGLSPLAVPKTGLGQVLAVPKVGFAGFTKPSSIGSLVSTIQGVKPSTASALNYQTLGLGEGLMEGVRTTPAVESLGLGEGVKVLTEPLTLTKVLTKTGTETQIKTSTKTKTETRVRLPLIILPTQSGKKLEEGDITPGTITWHGGLYWNIVPPPYEKRYSSKTPPPGAKYTNITGKGMAKKTLQMIGGPAPKTADVRLGFMDVHITKGSTKIEFVPTSRGRDKRSGSFVMSNVVVQNSSISRSKVRKPVSRQGKTVKNTEAGASRVRV
jgi:hypothetical protein